MTQTLVLFTGIYISEEKSPLSIILDLKYYFFTNSEPNFYENFYFKKSGLSAGKSGLLISTLLSCICTPCPHPHQVIRFDYTPSVIHVGFS